MVLHAHSRQTVACRWKCVFQRLEQLFLDGGRRHDRCGKPGEFPLVDCGRSVVSVPKPWHLLGI